MVVFSIFVASLVALAAGNPMSRRSMVVLESRSSLPAGFVKEGPAPSDAVLTMHIALKQNNPEGLTKALLDVSTPGNELYGQHLTKEEVRVVLLLLMLDFSLTCHPKVEAFVAPAADTVKLVNDWLSENEISASTISPAGDWLRFSITAEKASSLLDAEFATFKHEASGETSIRTMEYSIPADLTDHVALVHPTITYVPPANRST